MLQLSYILLTIILALALYIGASRITLKAFPETARQKRFLLRFVLFLVLWLLYVSGISLTGIFTSAAMPPRIPLLLVLPVFVFMVLFFVRKGNKQFIAATPLSWLLYLQSFRIFVELLIWWAFVEHVLPKDATFEGYNFDIIFGITAPFIAYAMNKNNRFAFACLIWNFCGLLSLGIVVFVLMSHAYFPALWGTGNSILNDGIGHFPFTLLGGVFMPLAVFLHVFAIIKIKRMMNG